MIELHDEQDRDGPPHDGHQQRDHQTDGNGSRLWCPIRRVDGTRCFAWPTASGICAFHDPARRALADAGRRLGGRQRAVAATGMKMTADVPNLGLGKGIQALLQLAAADALNKAPSFQRAKVLASIALAAARVLEVVQLQARIVELEKDAGLAEPWGADA